MRIRKLIKKCQAQKLIYFDRKNNENSCTYTKFSNFWVYQRIDWISLLFRPLRQLSWEKKGFMYKYCIMLPVDFAVAVGTVVRTLRIRRNLRMAIARFLFFRVDWLCKGVSPGWSAFCPISSFLQRQLISVISHENNHRSKHDLSFWFVQSRSNSTQFDDFSHSLHLLNIFLSCLNRLIYFN